MIQIVISIVSILFLLYGLMLLIILTSPSVSTEKELESVKEFLKISLLISSIIFGLITLSLFLTIFFITKIPSIAENLGKFKFIIGLCWLASLIALFFSIFLKNVIEEENPDYGKNIISKEEIMSAKKDYLLRVGLPISVFGLILISLIGYITFNTKKSP